MMDYLMMEQRRNTHGYCCSFNYIRKHDDNPLLSENLTGKTQINFSNFHRNTPYYSDVTGPDMGLILVINNSADDYFYNIFNSIGSSVS